MRALNLRKVYKTGYCGTFEACKWISFGLDYGDCFALLGVNGAGKTTTFKMLTGLIHKTNGDIKICDYDVSKNFNKVRRQIGYCPQFDAIFPEMTVSEHLYFYAWIKKIPKRLHQKLIEQQL